jgi:hypothetical protein
MYLDRRVRESSVKLREIMLRAYLFCRYILAVSADYPVSQNTATYRSDECCLTAATEQQRQSRKQKAGHAPENPARRPLDGYRQPARGLPSFMYAERALVAARSSSPGTNSTPNS